MNWQPWIVAAAFLFWPLRWLLQGGVTVRTPVRLAALLFLFTIPLPILVSTNMPRSWETVGYLVAGIVLANAAINMSRLQHSPESLAWLLVAFAFALALIGPLIIAQPILGAAALTRLQDASGPLTSLLGETINPNILSHALLAVVPFAATFAMRGDWTDKRWPRWIFIAATVIMSAVILLTESRGALLALGVIFLLLLLLRFPRLRWVAPLAIIAVIALFAWGGQGVLDALTQASNGSATSGFGERVELWQRGLYAIQDFPFTGIGLGTYGTVIPFLYPFLRIPPNTFIPDAHNLPIQVGVDLGIPGLVTWLAMIFCLVVMMITVLRRTDNPMRWVLAAGVLASIVGMLVSGIFAATNWGVKPAFLPWLVGAIGLLVHRQEWDEESRVPRFDEEPFSNDDSHAGETDGAAAK